MALATGSGNGLARVKDFLVLSFNNSINYIHSYNILLPGAQSHELAEPSGLWIK